MDGRLTHTNNSDTQNGQKDTDIILSVPDTTKCSKIRFAEERNTWEKKKN